MMDTNAALYGDLTKILVKREDIAKEVKKLGERITADYQGKELMMVGILKGAVVFFADLLREIDLPVKMEIDYVRYYERK